MRFKKILAFLLVVTMTIALLPADASAAKKIKLKNTPATKVMRTGSTFALKTNYKASALKYTSSKKKVATVTKKGVIRAKKKGKTTITIKKGSITKKLKVKVLSPSGYSITKKAGTYTGSVTTTVKAKKGYKVYYSTNGKFKKSKAIASNKSKTFTFTSTKTLYLYPAKAKKKMTTARLNKTKKKYKKRADYLYKIIYEGTTSNKATATDNGTTDATATPIAVTTPGHSSYKGDDSASDYTEVTRTEYDDVDTTDTVGSDATEITIPSSAPSKKIEESNYTISKKNKLTITASGTYVISTETTASAVDGLIEADYDDTNDTGVLYLVLDGVNLTSSNNTAPTSDTGLITIKKSVARAVITVLSGTTNTLTDTGETGIDSDDNTSTTYTAGIVCKKIPLTINGTGTLNITSEYGNGIKATESLKILDATISVSGSGSSATGHNGITGKTSLSAKDADLTVSSDGDAFKTTLDDSDVADDSTLAELGNMDIDGGTYTFTSANGDAISVYRTLYLNPTSLSATTKNEAASTADSSYKAIKAGTTIEIPDTAGTITADTTATYSASRSTSDSNDSVADDTIHCDEYIKIDGGTLNLASGDDGIHSDTGLVINGGTITISESYEGLESGDITINGGVIDVTSRDDGLNAAGGNDTTSESFNKGQSATNEIYQIIINDGTLTVDADGDGIDANGSIFFMGGTVTVNGSEDSSNGALDYGDGSDCVCEISGGTLIAAGAVGMDDAPTSGSSQPAVNVRLSSVQSAGTYVVLKDSSGNTVMTAQPTKRFQSVIMSCESLTLGSSYTIYYGNSLTSLTQCGSFTFTSVSVATGNSTTDPGSGWGSGTPGSSQGRF